MLKELVKQWFKEEVTLNTEAPRELRDRLLIGHPNLEGFFDKLVAQFEQAEKLCAERGVKLRRETMQQATYDMTRMFMKGMEGAAIKRFESDMAKIKREREEDKIKEFDAVLRGEQVGEFAEAGVITNDEIDAQREVINAP